MLCGELAASLCFPVSWATQPVEVSLVARLHSQFTASLDYVRPQLRNGHTPSLPAFIQILAQPVIAPQVTQRSQPPYSVLRKDARQ